MNAFVKASLLACLIFACLVAAQQQAQPQTNQDDLTQCPRSDSKPKPATQTYQVQNSNQTCLVVQFAAYLSVEDGKFVDLKNGRVDVKESHCENQTANPPIDPKIIINFDCGNLTFVVGTNNSKVFIKTIAGSYFNLSQNGTNSFENTTEHGIFSTTQPGHYYKCNAEQSVPTQKTNVTLFLSNFAYEAYRTASGTEFYQIAEECGLDSGPVSDLVLVGVGICLVVLVAIVLVAYFIGRRRWAERSSYESV